MWDWLLSILLPSAPISDPANFFFWAYAAYVDSCTGLWEGCNQMLRHKTDPDLLMARLLLYLGASGALFAWAGVWLVWTTPGILPSLYFAGSLLFWVVLAQLLTALFILIVLIRITVPRFKMESLSKLGWQGLLAWALFLTLSYLLTFVLV